MPKSTEELKDDLRQASGLEGFLVDNQKDFRQYTLAEYLNQLLAKAPDQDGCRSSFQLGTNLCLSYIRRTQKESFTQQSHFPRPRHETHSG